MHRAGTHFNAAVTTAQYAHAVYYIDNSE